MADYVKLAATYTPGKELSDGKASSYKSVMLLGVILATEAELLWVVGQYCLETRVKDCTPHEMSFIPSSTSI